MTLEFSLYQSPYQLAILDYLACVTRKWIRYQLHIFICSVPYPGETHLSLKMKGFYDTQCPICLAEVEIQQQDCFYILPVHPANTGLLSLEDWQLGRTSVITISGVDLRLSQMETYPTLEYRQRSFLIHRRCYELVGPLSSSQLRTLIDVVEPTFLPSGPPLTSSMHGAFYSPAVRGDPSILSRLPPEIQDKVLEQDIGRLLFVMRTASKLARIQDRELKVIPEHRFAEEILDLKSRAIRIYLVDVGGRRYVSQLSDAPTLYLSGVLERA